MTNERYFDDDVISVAVSYSGRSHANEFEEIRRILQLIKTRYRRRYKIEVFVDWNLSAGAHFEEEIPYYFRNADIIICLVTNNFLYNKFILKHEKPIILDRVETDKFKRVKTVVPILISRSHYSGSWLYKKNIVTLPERMTPVVNFKPKYEAWGKVESGLDELFTLFQKYVVEKRIGNNNSIGEVGNNSAGAKRFILIVLALLLSLITYHYRNEIINLFKEAAQERVATGDEEYTIDETSDISNYDNESDIDNTINDDNYADDYDLEEDDVTYDTEIESESLSDGVNQIININGDCRQESNRPLKLHDYKYYGKEIYGIFNSCQGIDSYGNKPCKLNRKWYVVNNRMKNSWILNFDDKTHKKIYAIRPFNNGTAEVYYHNGKNKYLAFCITLKDGKILP